MSANEIEKIRDISKAKDSQAWKDYWSEMAKKTVIRRISKRLPMSSDLEVIIHRDNETLNFRRHDVNSHSSQIDHDHNDDDKYNNNIIDITSASTQIETSEDGEVQASEANLNSLNNVESVVLVNKVSPVEKGASNDKAN